MRSRDGNFNLLLRFCSLAITFSLSTQASEYIISYRFVVKDATLYNETLHISKAMQKCSGIPQTPLLLTTYKDKNLKKTIKNNEQEFIDFIHKLGLSVEHKEKTTNHINRSTTILTLKSTCFKVDFNDNFAKITPLK
ncbi:hypothetical protein M947_09545 [Sulfurimonas hongkongensis]|uniref:Uncharacterized protein n=1 Tax=Sulfurimonas hongkongensis TaxID=1172190 RepID=T0KQC2_9BACT|nr:hypothetical protein [Sulfurimonas hongkongensis]EQB35518.1 hypothetical protein M947_09545 [Sulfurimonas hongkongensis]